RFPAEHGELARELGSRLFAEGFVQCLLVRNDWLGDSAEDLAFATAAFGAGEQKEVPPCDTVGCRKDFQARPNRGADDTNRADGGQCGGHLFTTGYCGNDGGYGRRERFNGKRL